MIITGDWKQQLTVIEDSYGTNAQVAACIQSSHLYPHFRPFQLTQNMRLLSNQQAFQKWLDEIGKGLTGDNVPISLDMLVHSRDELIQWVFDKGYNLSSNEMLKRLLLAVTNINVDLNNTIVLREMKNPIKHYYSVDRALEDDPFAVNAADYDVTHLNQMNPIGMPAHDIEISVGATIVLLSNLNTARGLCNGTRLIVKNLKNDLIEAEAITGGGLGGTIIGIPRVRSTHAAKHPHDVPFERFQFPIRVAFAMTITKAQGQTCERLGIDFTDEPFAHGQFYTSLSRCTAKEGIKIFAPNKKLDDQGRPLIRNVVAKGLDLS